ncbi:sensor histidine kinase [Staphylococcus coagulans]|uniref:sensor histidine kinase n=1 Tax=Staphylococcus coagulans TaxID=74706 RepID=UPI00315A9AC7
MYKKLFLETDNINEYLIYNPRSSFERTYNQQVQQLIKLQRAQSNKYEADKKLQKVLMYRFVHQMKTPISVMKLISENHNSDESFKIINQNLNTAQYHLDQMLDIYRLDDFKNDFVAEKVYLNAVCRDCINSLKDYFIVSQTYPKLDILEETYVYSDSKWLKLIITQILTNAIKYSDAGQPIRLVTEKNNDTVTLSITDYGMGIQDNELSKIFNLFYVGENGRNNADSSGIGLYIVKRVIEYLDHEVMIESKLNQGTTVFIKF